MVLGPVRTCQEAQDFYSGQNLWVNLSLGQPGDRSIRPRAGKLEPLAYFGGGRDLFSDILEEHWKRERRPEKRLLSPSESQAGKSQPRSRGPGEGGGLGREGTILTTGTQVSCSGNDPRAVLPANCI